MRVAHWTFLNGSGLSDLAISISKTESRLGIESVVCNTNAPDTWVGADDVDVHVIHSHIPDSVLFSTKRSIVAVQHGAPEHVFEESVRAGLTGTYGVGDSLALMGNYLRRADAVVTFWPRQEFIFKRMSSAPVFCIPLGIDTKYWMPVAKQKLLAGSPAILTSENCHACKWPIDLMFMWPYIVEHIPTARAHFTNVPYDQHRWWIPLAYMTTAMYTIYISPAKFSHDQLKQYVCAADYYYSPVEYGDYNMMSLQARSLGTPVISYSGNIFADYWIKEGDQREQADELLDILQGKREPREVGPIPDIEETAGRMLDIYRSLCHV